MPCTPESLADDAKCFVCIPPKVLQAIRIYLLCTTIDGEIVSCNPETLAAAAVEFLPSSVSPAMLNAIETYLVCQLNQSGGGGGGGGVQRVFSGNYGGGTPSDTPIASEAIAYDLDPPNNFWIWTGSAWI